MSGFNHVLHAMFPAHAPHPAPTPHAHALKEMRSAAARAHAQVLAAKQPS